MNEKPIFIGLNIFFLQLKDFKSLLKYFLSFVYPK